MTWFDLPVYADTALTTAMLEAIKADINETAAAKANTAGRHFASTGPHALAEREIRQAYIATSGNTTNGTFANLQTGTQPTGPTIANITTGPLALIVVECQAVNTASGASSRMSFEVSGATTVGALDDSGSLLQNEPGRDARYAALELQALTAGVQTVASKYRVSSGTGSFSARTLIVMAF